MAKTATIRWRLVCFFLVSCFAIRFLIGAWNSQAPFRLEVFFTSLAAFSIGLLGIAFQGKRFIVGVLSALLVVLMLYFLFTFWIA